MSNFHTLFSGVQREHNPEGGGPQAHLEEAAEPGEGVCQVSNSGKTPQISTFLYFLWEIQSDFFLQIKNEGDRRQQDAEMQDNRLSEARRNADAFKKK